MKKHNISMNVLKLDGILFHHKSSYIQYLKDNNIYDQFSTENYKGLLRIVPIHQIDDILLESSVTCLTSLLFVINQKKISDVISLVFDATLNLSNRYTAELKYIDELIINDELGWNPKQTELYNNFKIIMNNIITEADLSQKLVNKYNACIPVHKLSLYAGYKIRFINEILDMYKQLKFKKFQDEYHNIYNNCIIMKTEFIRSIRKQINCNKPPNEFFTLPPNPDIFDHFQNVLENSSNYEYIYQHIDKKYIELFHDNPKIQKTIKYLLTIGAVPLQSIQPIIYNHYNKYSTDEHFNLE